MSFEITKEFKELAKKLRIESTKMMKFLKFKYFEIHGLIQKNRI